MPTDAWIHKVVMFRVWPSLELHQCASVGIDGLVIVVFAFMTD